MFVSSLLLFAKDVARVGDLAAQRAGHRGHGAHQVGVAALADFADEVAVVRGDTHVALRHRAIVLGRAEAFANKSGVLDSACDGLGIGLGFTLSLTVLGLVREILGSGSAFGWKFMAPDGMLLFVLAPGAFIVLGYLMVLFRKLTTK